MGAQDVRGRPARTFRGQTEKTRLERVLQAFAQSRLGGKLFITVFPALDRRLMPLTRGRLRTGLGQPMILLHCRGARSGQPRTTPLLYTPRGEDLVLVASKAGAERHPAWYHNVIAHPDVNVDLDGRRRALRAREVQGAEREELWRLVNDNYSGYEAYQRRAGWRRIPVILLESREGAAAQS